MDLKELNKRIESLKGKFIQYKTRAALQYINYMEIHNNLQYIKRLTTYYTSKYELEKMIENASPDRQLTDDDIFPMHCIGISIVMLYGKCFDENSKRRRVRLKDDFLKGANAKIIKQHNELINIRHTYLAHAGISKLEKYHVVIGIDNNGLLRGKPDEDNYFSFLGEVVEAKNMIPLLDEVLIRVEKKIKELMGKIENEIDILREDAEGIVNKLETQTEINDTDLEN